MIATPEGFSELLDQLSSSTWTLAAVAVLFESGLAAELREPRTLDELAVRCTALTRERIARCLEVARTRGVVAVEGERFRLAPGALPFAEGAPRDVLLADCRSDLMQPYAYLDSLARPPARGWRHTDPALLQAQGTASSRFAAAFATRIAPQLGDLSARLAQPGARGLDVGVGVAALAIAYCHALPQVRIVGLDVADAPLALARDNVARAGLQDRIELRKLAVQELRDEAAFDFAWLPAVFIPQEHLAAAIARVRAALRPGGYIIVPTLGSAASPARQAVAALMLELWGNPLEADPALELLDAAGFADPRLIPGASWLALAVAAR